MFTKLAFRNVKRQIFNYLIYFITVTLTVALMFAINNVIFSKDLLRFMATSTEMTTGLTILSILVALIVAFVLGYASSFMLKLRKREFGTYLTLGMTRKNILWVFLLETLLMGAAALIVGIVIGFFLYQGFMMVIVKVMEINYTFAPYSMQGLLFTIALVAAVFILSSLTSAWYLKKVQIHRLIHGDRFVDKGVKHPVVWAMVTVTSLCAVIGSCFVFSHSFNEIQNSNEGAGMLMMLSIFVVALGIIFFHIGLAKSAVYLLLKNKRFRSKGANLFTLRQLSGKLSSNAVMAGAISFLFSFAIIGANFSFVQKAGTEESLKRTYPFDINYQHDPSNPLPFSVSQGEEIISRHTQIESKIPFSVYESDNGYLYSFTRWTGEGYEGLNDVFLKESDAKRLFEALGWEPLTLNGGYFVLAYLPQIMSADFSEAELTLNGKTYPYAGKSLDQFPCGFISYFVAVVPDEAVEGLPVCVDGISYNLQDGSYDAAALDAELSYSYKEPGGMREYSRSDYRLKEYARVQGNANTAILVVGAMYIAIVFVFLSFAILALKTLSGLSEDRKRYEILSRLGADRKALRKTLFDQIFIFFLLPFALPMLLSVPTALLCSQILVSSGMTNLVPLTVANACGVSIVLGVIYLLYYIATYRIAKRNVLPIR